MPKYRYLALNTGGTSERGVAEFASEAIAFSSLTAQGLTVVELDLIVSNVTDAAEAKTVTARRRLPLGTQADIVEQMAMMFAAGLPLLESLRLVASGSENQTAKRAFERVLRLVADGGSFPVAFKSVSSAFSPLVPALLSVSHESARGPQTLTALATYLRRQDVACCRFRGHRVKLA